MANLTIFPITVSQWGHLLLRERIIDFELQSQDFSHAFKNKQEQKQTNRQKTENKHEKKPTFHNPTSVM